ncbi:MAG TPA: hypothetical protein VF066_03615 [Thermoleophilaceae bacterium]
MRGGPDGAPQSVIALKTLGAPERRLIGSKRARKVTEASPEPVPTVRATMIAAEPFASTLEAEAWLAALGRDRDALAEEARLGTAELNRMLRAHRAAAADPWSALEVSPAHALVVRVGYGVGDLVAEGRFDDALELPRTEAAALSRARRGDPIGPGERMAAILSGRDELLACEELVLRARADLDAHRPREAALQARIALEAVLAELPSELDPELAASRSEIGDAANAALKGDPPDHLQHAVAHAVERMERALRRRPPPPEPGS